MIAFFSLLSVSLNSLFSGFIWFWFHAVKVCRTFNNPQCIADISDIHAYRLSRCVFNAHACVRPLLAVIAVAFNIIAAVAAAAALLSEEVIFHFSWLMRKRKVNWSMVQHLIPIDSQFVPNHSNIT